MKKITLILLFGILILPAVAQIIEPIKWSFDSKQNGREVELIFTADIEKNWHLYDTYLPEGGPIATQVVFEDSTLFEFSGELEKNPQPVEKFDEIFMMNLRFFSDQATLTQKIQLKSDDPVVIKGYVLFMGCDDEMCLPPNEAEFDFAFNGSARQQAPVVSGVAEGPVSGPVGGSASGQALWLFILISSLAGFAAILTPCVFPMIPMTVSFFMRGSDNRGQAIRSGLFFGLSILLIFALLGALLPLACLAPMWGTY
jgi:thiol:disulfide interchange protein